jgi:hypothetical protein
MVGHCHYAGLHIYTRIGNRLLKIGRKSGDSAAARERVANECQAAGGSQDEAAKCAPIQVLCRGSPFMIYFLLVVGNPKLR